MCAAHRPGRVRCAGGPRGRAHGATIRPSADLRCLVRLVMTMGDCELGKKSSKRTLSFNVFVSIRADGLGLGRHGHGAKKPTRPNFSTLSIHSTFRADTEALPRWCKSGHGRWVTKRSKRMSNHPYTAIDCIKASFAMFGMFLSHYFEDYFLC